jgi:signal transduction histidine kinase
MSGARETVKLLMVDDEAVLYHGVKRVLENFVIELPDIETEVRLQQSWVGSGEECLESIRGETPDLIFLDYKLPGMSGLDVLNHLRQNQVESTVVMITAFASLETAVKATKLGAFDFLSKPFAPDEIRYVAKKAATQIVLSRRARALQEDRKKVRFEFLSVLAHELKAPLNAIDGYLDILKDRVEGQEKMMVDRSLARLDGMRKLIFDLLDLTRIESGTKKRELAPLDLVLIVRRALETVEPEVARREIVVHAPECPTFPFFGDPGELDIIANNLISNAVKYNRDGGTVWIELARAGTRVEFRVRDTGVGISAADIEKLFREFSRIRNERTAQVLGSGLGLSTLKKLAGMYGGDVTVESQEYVGSLFTVTLQDAAAVEVFEERRVD